MNAETLTVRLEQLGSDEPWGELHAATTAANDAELAAADGELSPLEIPPTSLDTLEQYRMFLERCPADARFGEALAQVHARALASNPPLAALCRSPEAMADVCAAAARLAAPTNDLETFAAAGARAAAAARARFMVAIASAIAAVPGHELEGAAKRRFECVARGARIDAARQRLEIAAAAELERIEAEQRAMAAAVEAERARRVREATEAAAAAQAAAAQAANDARLVRAGVLVERLRERLARADQARTAAERVRLSHVDGGAHGYHDIASLVLIAPAMSVEQLGRFEALLAGGR